MDGGKSRDVPSGERCQLADSESHAYARAYARPEWRVVPVDGGLVRGRAVRRLCERPLLVICGRGALAIGALLRRCGQGALYGVPVDRRQQPRSRDDECVGTGGSHVRKGNLQARTSIKSDAICWNGTHAAGTQLKRTLQSYGQETLRALLAAAGRGETCIPNVALGEGQ